MKLASFDIFDTTLIRKCGNPENIFYLLANKLYPNDKAKREDFIVWRKRAPQIVQKKLKKIELTLHDIYTAEGVVSFNEYDVQTLINKELETETENLTSNPSITELINQKRRDGYKIAFISDMYIDSLTLRKILEKQCQIKPEDNVYVSCEIQARKDSGLLYQYVKQQLNPKIWEHYGDNRYSDVKIAQKNGIKATLVDTHNNTLEQRLEQLASQNPAFKELSLLTGISKTARLQNNNPFATIAANYVASAYVPFVKWIFEIAKKENIKTLYFLSRDSYILQKIAESIPHDEIELKYLFVSRRSLMRPYMYDSKPEDYLKIVDRHTLIGRDVKHMLWQLLLTSEELKEKYGFEYKYQRIKSSEEETDFINSIYNSKLTPDFQAEAQKEQEILLRYFEQEGVTFDNKKAFVDVGWLGTSRLMINAILQRNGFKPVDFIYYGTRNDVYPTEYGKYYSYFPAGTLNTNMTSVIENYYSASPYPTTIGYKEIKGILEPVFPEGKSLKSTKIIEENIKVSTWIASEIERYNIKEDYVLSTWGFITLHSIAKMIDDIDVSPFTTSDDFDNETFAKKFTFTEFVKFLLMGKRITHFDYASLKYTFGLKPAHWYMKIHKFTGRLRGYAFNYLMKKK